MPERRRVRRRGDARFSPGKALNRKIDGILRRRGYSTGGNFDRIENWAAGIPWIICRTAIHHFVSISNALIYNALSVTAALWS